MLGGPIIGRCHPVPVFRPARVRDTRNAHGFVVASLDGDKARDQ